MDTAGLIAQLRRDSARIGQLLADVDPGAPVSTCPGWAVRDLVHHHGAVQRWATGVVVEAPSSPAWESGEPGPFPGDVDLATWFTEGAERLVTALVEAPPDLDCWVFMADVESPRHFWARRQSHEAAIHRVDVEVAAGDTGDGELSGFEIPAAADGLDEIVVGFWSRPNRGPRADLATVVGFAPTDHDGRWTSFFDADTCRATRSVDAAEVQATVSGSVADLFAWAWDRPTLKPVTFNGDLAAIQRLKPDLDPAG